MTFDFHGTWSKVVSVNSLLYDDQGLKNSFDGCVEPWLRDGVDKSKINVGLPFYGRSYGRATELHSDFDGPDGLN
jgi:chitinase